MTQPFVPKRRQLLPIWMMIFIWLFMVLGGWVLLANFLKLIGITFGAYSSSIYGLETYDRYSLLAFFISGLILYKGVVSFCLYTEKTIAVRLAIGDAVLGLVVTLYVMFVEPLSRMEEGVYGWGFQFEIVLLIPYLIKCLKMRTQWESANSGNQNNSVPIINRERVLQNEEQKPSVVDDLKEEITNEEKTASIDKEDPTRFMPR